MFFFRRGLLVLLPGVLAALVATGSGAGGGEALRLSLPTEPSPGMAITEDSKLLVVPLRNQFRFYSLTEKEGNEPKFQKAVLFDKGLGSEAAVADGTAYFWSFRSRLTVFQVFDSTNWTLRESKVVKNAFSDEASIQAYSLLSGRILAREFTTTRATAYDLLAGRELFALTRNLDHYAYSPDGSLLAGYLYNEKKGPTPVFFFDGATGKQRQSTTTKYLPVQCAFHPDGKQFLYYVPFLAREDGILYSDQSRIQTIDVATGKEELLFYIEKDLCVEKIRFSADRSVMILAGDLVSRRRKEDPKAGNIAVLYDLKTKQELARQELSGTLVNYALSPDRRYFAFSCLQERYLTVVNLRKD